MDRAPVMSQHRHYGSITDPLLPSGDISGRPAVREEGLASRSARSIHGQSEGNSLEGRFQIPRLPRSRSTWGVAFMSFVLASVPYGLSTTLVYPLTGGGPVTIIWGWVLVCCLMLCVAISLGEITSVCFLDAPQTLIDAIIMLIRISQVYPVAGGVYYQTFMLSPKPIRSLMAWLAGWSFFLGNVIITLSINFGTTLFLIGCVNVFRDGSGVGIFAAERYQIYLIFLVLTLLCNTVSAMANKWLPILGKSCPP